MDERVSWEWRVPLMGAALVSLSLLTVHVRTGVIAEARELHLQELLRASLERRLDDLSVDLTARWQQLNVPEARKGDHRP